MRLVDADYIKESVKRQCDNCRKEGMKWMADSVERAIIEELDNTPTAQPERQVELDGAESNIEILSELRAQFNCFDEVEEPCYRALSDAICALSAQPHWIPCSERLPEANGRYLVTRGLNACGALWNRVYIINYTDLMGLKSGRIWWDGNVGKSDFEQIADVIAWMPLPKLYGGDGDE